jgi:anti-sigma regulatory factor (Ser/Thr protein kinase)
MAGYGPTDNRIPAIPLPQSGNAAGIARAFVERQTSELPPDLVDDALLLVSELVTNAVRHGRPDIRLEVSVSPPGIEVAVRDGGEDLPQMSSQPTPGTAESGRGLRIVDAVASAWGVIADSPPPGKVVWFELHPPPTD